VLYAVSMTEKGLACFTCFPVDLPSDSVTGCPEILITANQSKGIILIIFIVFIFSGE
jgi:hypothetical protein